jgi:hypothetical protein
MTNRQVPPPRPRTKDEVSDALASDWLRLAPLGHRVAFSLQIGADSDGKTVSKAISGEHVPAAHTVLNSLVADPSALFNTLRLYDGCFVPIAGKAPDDMAAISAMLHAATEYLDRMKDGRRCHVDTAALAKLFIPLIPQMLAIVEEANGKSPKLEVVAA